MSQIKNSLILVGILFSFSLVANEKKEPIWYVQAVQTWARSGPSMKTKKVAKLKRGLKVRQVEKKGKWLQVRVGQKRFWISRFFLSQFKPIGRAKLVNDLRESEEKASRKRSKDYATAAAIRMLMGGEKSDDLVERGLTSARVRRGRVALKKDDAALEELESAFNKDLDMGEFVKQANLNR